MNFCCLRKILNQLIYYFCIVLKHKKTLASKAKFPRLLSTINRLRELDEKKINMKTKINKLKIPILILFVFLTIIGVNVKVKAQSACTNIDFSLQNFTNWSGCYCITQDASCYTPIMNADNPPNCTPVTPTPPIACGTTGFLTTSTPDQPSLHTILTPAMLNYPNGNLDSITNWQLHKIPPGVDQVVRLNSWQINYETSSLSYEMLVDTNVSGLFIYSYAAVLENPDIHTCDQQPYFQIRILDANGNPINNQCGTFTYVAGTTGTFVNIWSNNNINDGSDINWFDWQTVGLDLKPYQGQNIKIQFIAADCAIGGHFGYAYFYAKCLPRRINIAFCPNSTTAVLTAPDGFNYKWIPNNETTQSISIVNPIDSSIYKCIITSKSNTACSDTIDALLVPNIINSNFTFNNACVDVPVTFTRTTTSNTPIYCWYWNFGEPGSIGNYLLLGNTVSHTFTSPGTYYVTLVDSIVNGCPDTNIQAVTIYPKPIVTSLNDSICPGDSALLIGYGAATYSWNDGYNGNQHYVSPSITSPYVVLGTSSFGCQDSATSIVTVFPAPQISYDADKFKGCSPITVNFSNYTDPPNCFYNWNFGDGLTDTTASPTHTFLANNSTSQPASFNITLTATTIHGCTSTYTSANLINVYPVPHADYTWSPNPGLIEVPIIFTNTSSPTNSSYLYIWNFADGSSTSNDINPSHVYAVNGTYNVMLISTSDYNCSDTIRYNVLIINDSLIFPNVITPNNDGVNDYFVIKGLVENNAFPDNKLIIYNRWGKKVYESSNYQNKFNGDGLPDGVYFYIFNGKGILREIEHKSSLEILR